jgi:hypothetical protein
VEFDWFLFKPGTVFCFYFCVGACCVEIKIFGSSPAVLTKMNCLQKIQDIFRTYNRGLIEGNGSLFLVAEIEESNGNRTIDRLPHNVPNALWHFYVTFFQSDVTQHIFITRVPIRDHGFVWVDLTRYDTPFPPFFLSHAVQTVQRGYNPLCWWVSHVIAKIGKRPRFCLLMTVSGIAIPDSSFCLGNRTGWLIQSNS